MDYFDINGAPVLAILALTPVQTEQMSEPSASSTANVAKTQCNRHLQRKQTLAYSSQNKAFLGASTVKHIEESAQGHHQSALTSSVESCLKTIQADTTLDNMSRSGTANGSMPAIVVGAVPAAHTA